MKKQIVMFLIMSTAMAFTACDDKPKQEDKPGVYVDGKKGGGMEINKDKMEIDGKKGGELKMDSNGVKIKTKNDK